MPGAIVNHAWPNLQIKGKHGRSHFLAVVTTAVLFAGAASAEPVSYKLDATHTIVVVEVRHAGISTSRALIQAREVLVALDYSQFGLSQMPQVASEALRPLTRVEGIRPE